MKFQNRILINFVTDGRTHTQTDKPKAICPFNFSKVGGHNNCVTQNFLEVRQHQIDIFEVWPNPYNTNQTTNIVHAQVKKVFSEESNLS